MTNHSPGPWREEPGKCGVFDANSNAILMLGVKQRLNPADIALVLGAPDAIKFSSKSGPRI
jgi:hypothetical protein